VPLLLLVLARILAWVVLPIASEDAYITFRFARDFATGHGLVYNPGERVFGFSSLPWTLWSAIGYLLLHDPVTWTRATSLVADVLTWLLVGRMLMADAVLPEDNRRTSTAVFGFFFALWPYFSVVAVSGMENPAMLALIALGAALARRRSPFSGPVLGALALWRPEGVVAAAVLSLGARWRDRLVALLVFAIGVAALIAYFGTAIPQSVIAKASLYGTPGPLAGHHWWDWLVPLQLGSSPTTGEGRFLYPLAVVFAPALVAGGALLWRRRDAPLTLAVAACLAVWAGYTALGVAYFYWYLVVPLGGLAALAAAGLPRILRGRWAYAACALFVLSSWIGAYPLYVGRAQNEYYGFVNAAAFLGEYAHPGEKVMLEPIGIVGYRCPVVVVDETGLVTPTVARRRMQGPGWYADIAATERPDWIVVRRGELASAAGFAGAGAPFRSMAERDSLLVRYEVAAHIDTISGDASFIVLHRIRS
jgi:MYXO-CTERM domain-containing protein